METRSRRRTPILSTSGDSEPRSSKDSLANHSESLAPDLLEPLHRSTTRMSPKDLSCEDLAGGNRPTHGLIGGARRCGALDREHDYNFPSAEQQGTDARDPDKPDSAISSGAAKFGCDVKVSKRIFLGLAGSSLSELAPSTSAQNREPEEAVPTGTDQEPTLDVSDSSIPLAVSVAISPYSPSESGNTGSLTLVRHLAPPAGAQACGASVRRCPLPVARTLSLLSPRSLIQLVLEDMGSSLDVIRGSSTVGGWMVLVPAVEASAAAG
jgi:hypothetical protein